MVPPIRITVTLLCLIAATTDGSFYGSDYYGDGVPNPWDDFEEPTLGNYYSVYLFKHLFPQVLFYAIGKQISVAVLLLRAFIV